MGQTDSPEIILAAGQAEIDACLGIRTAVFTIENGIPEALERDAWDRPGSGCRHYLFRHQGRDAGTVRFVPDGQELKLQRFCFLREYRRLGLGKKALAHLEGDFRSMGFTRIRLDAKYQAVGFYEKCGYHRDSPVFMEVGIPHIAMSKEL